MWLRAFNQIRAYFPFGVQTPHLRVLLAAIAFVLFSPAGESQAWHPLPNAYEANRYDYALGESQFPEYPLVLDSISLAGGDSTLWTRLYPFPCDTCSGGFPECPARYYPGLPLFLGHSLRHVGNGEFLLEGWKDTFYIRTNDPVSSTWTFEASTGIMATVDNAFDTLLWETALDSVKRILIGAAPGQDTILISKRHGILRFPKAFGSGDSTPYRLSGIAGSNIGRYIPSVLDAFALEEGSLLQYDFASGGFIVDIDGTFQIEITEILYHEQDSMKVLVEGALYKRINDSSPIGGGITERYCRVSGFIQLSSDRLRYELSGPPASGCGFSYYDSDNLLIPPYDPQEWQFGSYGFFVRTHRAMRLFNQRMVISNNIAASEEPLMGGGAIYCSDFLVDTAQLLDDWGWSFQYPTYPGDNWQEFEVAEGIGIVYVRSEGYDQGQGINLTAYRIGDESWGTFEDTTAWPLGHQSINASVSFGISPNPSTGKVFVSGWDQPAIASIFNMTGQKVLEHPFQPGMPIDLSALPNGLYWIELQNKDQRGLARVSLIRP